MDAPREHSSENQLFVVSFRTGRLANRLVLFANLVAYAEDRGHRVANVPFHSYAHLFETTCRDIYCRYPVARRRSAFDLIPGVARAIRATRVFYRLVRAAAAANAKLPRCGGRVVTLTEIADREVTLLDDPAIQTAIADARLVFVHGWGFRAPDAVERHAETIRRFFRPIESIERKTRETVARLRQNADVVVGVHIRQGDYRVWKEGRFAFDASRYAAWMHEMTKQFPGRGVSFVVCSDEPRRRDEFAGLSVEIGAGPPVNDLWLLAQCDYIIGPLSTFSQWASFYGNVPLLHLLDSDHKIELEKFRVSFLETIP